MSLKPLTVECEIHDYWARESGLRVGPIEPFSENVLLYIYKMLCSTPIIFEKTQMHSCYANEALYLNCKIHYPLVRGTGYRA